MEEGEGLALLVHVEEVEAEVAWNFHEEGVEVEVEQTPLLLVVHSQLNLIHDGRALKISWICGLSCSSLFCPS